MDGRQIFLIQCYCSFPVLAICCFLNIFWILREDASKIVPLLPRVFRRTNAPFACLTMLLLAVRIANLESIDPRYLFVSEAISDGSNCAFYLVMSYIVYTTIKSTVKVTKTVLSPCAFTTLDILFVFFAVVTFGVMLGGFLMRFLADLYAGSALTAGWLAFYDILNLVGLFWSVVKLRNHMRQLSMGTYLIDRQFEYISGLVNDFTRTSVVFAFIAGSICAVQISRFVQIVHDIQMRGDGAVNYVREFGHAYNEFDVYDFLKTLLIILLTAFAREKKNPRNSASASSEPSMFDGERDHSLASQYLDAS